MTVALSPRAETVLRRFPSHLDLADPTKAFADVVAALAVELDAATSAAGRIRRNHRLLDVGNEWDLLALAGLHGIDEAAFDVLERRIRVIAAAAHPVMLDPSDRSAADELRGRLLDLVAVGGDVFPAFAEEADDVNANQRLAHSLAANTTYATEMSLRRIQAIETIRQHHVGNGSVGGLLEATADMLALDVTAVVHHPDRYWHFALCEDRMRLAEPQPAGAPAATVQLERSPDLIALEENPFKPADVAPAPRPHGQIFAITRAGWETVPVTVRVLGIADRCFAPMVVNVDTGAGVAFAGAVAEGAELRFETTGRVTLGPEGVPNPPQVGRNSFSFSGAVFAASSQHSKDFVWADADDTGVGGDRAAHFVVTAPLAQALTHAAPFPHAGGLIDPPTLLVNTTRWALFVRAAHFGREHEGPPEPATPSFLAGRWDRSVFDPTEPDGTRLPSGRVGFDWLEREAFALCVWLPRRFETLDTDEELPIRERVRLLLDRHRAAGVHVGVKYADDRWTLGVGITRDPDAVDAMGIIVAGTRLWLTPTEQ